MRSSQIPEATSPVWLEIAVNEYGQEPENPSSCLLGTAAAARTKERRRNGTRPKTAGLAPPETPPRAGMQDPTQPTPGLELISHARQEIPPNRELSSTCSKSSVRPKRTGNLSSGRKKVLKAKLVLNRSCPRGSGRSPRRRRRRGGEGGAREGRPGRPLLSSPTTPGKRGREWD